MNAVRIRKENQVYTALEKKALALIQLEEKKQKDAALVADFRRLLERRQEAAEGGGAEGAKE
jgi:hypothetical protein